MNQYMYQAIVEAHDVCIGYASKKARIAIAEHLHVHIFKGENRIIILKRKVKI